MALPLPKTHIIRTHIGDRVKTYCGMEGFDSGWPGEWDTHGGDRFDAVPPGGPPEEAPTCRACQKYRAIEGAK